MTARGGGALYTPDLLSLAVSLADYPLNDELPLRGEARSRSCGSTVTFATEHSDGGAIGRVGLQVSACAVGQAAAAIFARHAPGLDPSDIVDAQASIARWLAGEGDRPDWPGIERLEPALGYPGRHGAILLPWNAAAAALCKVGAGR